MTQSFPLENARVQMTLAALAYAADKDPDSRTIPPLHHVKKAIQEHLAQDKYATGGDWGLIWGPVQTHGTDNLVYLAQSTSGDLAVCLRGTATQWTSIREDLPSGQSPFPSGNQTGAKVSKEFLAGLSEMLAAHDSESKTHLLEAVAGALPEGGTVYVTGHSQGAALVPMMAAAVKVGWGATGPVTDAVRGFAFAAPTSGNPAFADWVNDSLDCWFVTNPLDVVPLGYSAMDHVISKQIPGPMPSWPESWGIEAAVKLADGIAYETGPWQQPAQQAHLNALPLHALGFFKQVMGQHNHNSYLYLLGAPIIESRVPDPTPMDGTPVPVPAVTNVPVGGTP